MGIVDPTHSMYVTAVFLSVMFAVIGVKSGHKAGMGRHNWELGIFIFIAMSLVFAVIGWLPYWIVILYVILASVWLANKLGVFTR